MLCKIADLITEVPDIGGLAPRVRDYLWKSDEQPDVIVRESDFRPDVWKGLPYDLYCYMESGSHFYANLLYFEGMMLHASAVAYGGRAYLFSGYSGVGKSTHTQLWKAVFGDEAVVFNDDKPALRLLNGRWYAYGTPWCGKDGINVNLKVPLAGICFLEQGNESTICRLSSKEAIPFIIPQTLHRFKTTEKAQLMLKNVENLISSIPMFHFINQPNQDAVRLSYECMLFYSMACGL